MSYNYEDDCFASQAEVDDLYKAAQALVVEHGEFKLHGFYTFTEDSEDGLPIVGLCINAPDQDPDLPPKMPKKLVGELVPHHELLVGRPEILRHVPQLIGVVAGSEVKVLNVMYAEACLPITSDDVDEFWPSHVDISVSDRNQELTVVIEDDDEGERIAKAYRAELYGNWVELKRTECLVFMDAFQALARHRKRLAESPKRQDD